MSENQVYYRPAGKESKIKRGSKITRDFINGFILELNDNLASPNFLRFLSDSRIPNERELYGIFVQSILNSCEKEDIGHIATEFQVGRKNELGSNTDPKGRVDLFFHYRSVSFLIEFKVGRVNASENKGIQQKAQKLWCEAIKQLDDLEITTVEKMMKKKIVMLPIILYFHVSRKPQRTTNCENIHDRILDSIKKVDGKDVSELIPDFDFCSGIDRTATRLRKTHINDEHNNYVYGVSIFAKQINVENPI